MTDNSYYTVLLRAFAFDTKTQAQEFADKLLDAFCAMPEAEEYAASTTIEEEIE